MRADYNPTRAVRFGPAVASPQPFGPDQPDPAHFAEQLYDGGDVSASQVTRQVLPPSVVA
jgi:hypothetical protein